MHNKNFIIVATNLIIFPLKFDTQDCLLSTYERFDIAIVNAEYFQFFFRTNMTKTLSSICFLHRVYHAMLSHENLLKYFNV